MLWIEFAATGLCAGFLAGYLGIGGGLVLVPALSWIFSQNPVLAPIAVQMAVATSLASMLFSSMSSLLAHHRQQAIRWPLVKLLAPGLLLGALLGSVIADTLSSDVLGSIFGVFALLISLKMITGKAHLRNRPIPGILSGLPIAFGIGGMSSLLGIGGGSMTVPWLMAHGQRVQNAIATSAACGYPIALAGTLGFMFLGEQQTGHTQLGYVNLQALAGVAAFSILAAPLGALTVHRSSPLIAKRLFALFMLVVAVKMLLR